MTTKKVRVLCVDDEPAVLEGLSLHLRRRYEVTTAPGGAAGLSALQKHPDVAVVVSDMRMPGMDGATFLSQVRQQAPDTVRILLTGQADMDSAIAAVNEGGLFRFLTKPCPPPTFLRAIDAAADQHRLVTAERVLLEQTLHGCVRTLTDVLSLTNPVSFGRAQRLKQLVSELCAALKVRETWQVEVAAMLSQLGCITLPAETAEKMYFGQALDAEEKKRVDQVPALTEQLLAPIPRLEAVREILATYPTSRPRPDLASASPKEQLVPRGAQLLRLAVDFDSLESRGNTPALALDTLRGRAEQYEPALLAALATVRGSATPQSNVREVSPQGLRPGMVMVDDVKLASGVLLVPRGYEVTASFLERVRAFPPGALKPTMRVLIPGSAPG